VAKYEVAKRFYDIVYRNLYLGESYRFPRLEVVRREGKELVCRFSDCGGGFKDAPLRGFTVAGKDGKYYEAVARVISGCEVSLTAFGVADPADATYAFFQYNNLANLVTKDGRPAFPFRTRGEDCGGKPYYFIQPWTGCDVRSVMENNFGSEAGGGKVCKLWNGGALTRSRSAVRVQNKITYAGAGAVEVRGGGRNADYFYFGASPEIGLCGCPHFLWQYRYLSVWVNGDADTEFHGLLLKVGGGDIYKLEPADGQGNRKQYVMLSGGFSRYTFDTDAVNTGGEWLVPFTDAQKRAVCQIEFYFRSKAEKTVYIDGVSLHD
jgi:hypothetical protein